MSTFRLDAYPWSQGKGLCPLLRSDKLWKQFYTEHRLRRGALDKAYRKRNLRAPSATHDLSLLTDATVRLLETPAGRKIFFECLAKIFTFEELGNGPVQLGIRLLSDQLSFLPRSAAFRQVLVDDAGSFGLSTAVLGRDEWWLEWLQECEGEQIDHWLVSLVACAAAILYPARGRQIAEGVLVHVPACAEWLAEATPVADREPEVSPEPPGDTAASAVPAVLRLAPAEPEADRVPDGEGDPAEGGALPVAQIEPAADAVAANQAAFTDLTEQEARAQTATLEEQLRRMRRSLERLDEMRARVSRRLSDASAHPLLRGRTGMLPSWNGMSITKTEEHLQAWESELGQTVQAAEQLQAMLERSGHVPPEFRPGRPGDLVALREQLEEHVLVLEEKLREIAERQQAVTRLLTTLENARDDLEVQFIEEVSSSDWPLIVPFLLGDGSVSKTPGKAAGLAGRWDLGGLAVAATWPRNQSAGLALASLPFAPGRTPPTRAQLSQWLAFFSLAQMQSLVQAVPPSAPPIMELWLACVLRHDRLEALEYLGALLDAGTCHPACRGFYDAVSTAHHRGELHSPAAQLRPVNAGAAEPSADDVDRRFRLALADYIRRPITMEKTYAQLRNKARQLFLLPLESVLQNHGAAETLAHWRDHGSLDNMVEACVQEMPGNAHVENPHREKTRRYLEDFQRDIERWAQQAATQPSDDALPPGEVRAAIERLQGEANADCRSLLEVLRTAVSDPDAGAWPARDFGQRVSSDGWVHVDLAACPDLLTPVMTLSWPGLVASGRVSMLALLRDWMMRASGNLPSLGQAVDGYVRRRQFAAALRASDTDPALAEYVRASIEGTREEFKRAHATVLDEAGTMAGRDKAVRDGCAEVDRALELFDYATAREWVGILDEYLREWRQRNDPERQALCAFLREMGDRMPESAPLSELRQRAAALRAEHSPRRVHVEEFLNAAATPDWPPVLRERWNVFAREIDQAALWPEADTAELLAAAVVTFADHVKIRLPRRANNPARFDRLAQSYAEWVPLKVGEFLRGGADAQGSVFDQILNVEGAARAYDDDEVLTLIGSVSPPPETLQPTPAEPVPLSDAPAPRRVARLLEMAPVPIVEEVRQRLLSRLAEEPAEEDIGQPVIREKVHGKDWAAVRMMAAGWLQLHRDQLPPDRFLDVEAIYAVARTETLRPDDSWSEAHETSLLASASADMSYYMDMEEKGHLSNYVADGVIKLAGETTADGGRNGAIRRLLEMLGGLADSELRNHPFARVLVRASEVKAIGGHHASYWIAWRLYPLFAGFKDQAKPRGLLLLVLFRLNLIRDLEELATEYCGTRAQYGETRAHLIVNCLRMFANAESDPESQPQAMYLYKAVKDRGGDAPWEHFFSLLNRSKIVGPPLVCVLESDFAEVDGRGQCVVEVCIKPSFVPLEQVVLELGDGGRSDRRILLEGELFSKARSFQVPLPGEIVRGKGDTLRVPWRITGRTSLGEDIDLRGAWTVLRTEGQAPTTLPKPVVFYWPGAMRLPVDRQNGLHGRTREIERIRQALTRVADRQSSIMVIGQRRIGKTSLLKQMVSELLPERGDLCGAFFDIAGLTIPAEVGSMPGAFFQEIVGGLDRNENQHVRQVLRAHSGPEATVAALATDLRPENSLLDALEQLAERLAEATAGKIQRLALFVDEFDRFVEPMVSGRKGEANKFMWNLRSVVQRSTRVSLVLAGSGLLRMMTEDYSEPLHGSIDEIQINPFRLDEDQEAIRDTVLPAEIRGLLCREFESDGVMRHAWEVCGGHPMYLAILGAAAAILGSGRHWTPGFLNFVADTLVEKGVDAANVKVGPSTFYGHNFETLEQFPLRTQALAKLLLAHIAEQTTIEYPWMQINQAINPLALPPGFSTEERRTLLIKDLVHENVVRYDQGRVRITVPITAAALRHDAADLKQRALWALEPTG